MLALVGSIAFACNAAAILSKVAAATGGDSWKSVGEIVASGALSTSGLRGIAELRDDVRTGRYANRFWLPVAGTHGEVYDGHTVWARDISGGVHPYDSWYPRARAVTDAYLTRRQYLNPNAGAHVTCARSAKDGSGHTQLVRVEPRGGVPAVLSIDTQTHLIDSIAIRTPISTDVTALADYRQVGGIVLPFAMSSGTLFEPQNGDRIEVARYVVTHRVNARDFEKPRPIENARMVGKSTSTTVPIVLEGRQLLVQASIDGHAPMPFILDAGGHAILDTVAARTLGLHPVGGGVSGGAGGGTIVEQYARVASVRIGSAELRDLPFYVIPYSYSFYERGLKTPLAGILGLEWFERYAARIDYIGRTLTLTPLARFKYRGHATGLPIHFQEDMPLAAAAADGKSGDFGVDTGNAAILILYGDFLRRTGLLAKYAPGYIVHSEGTGGSATGQIETLSRFRIGGHTIANIAADFTQVKTGSFSSWTEAGDLGITVLSRFTPTFDYANEMLYLDPVARPLAIPRNRSGLGFTKNQLDAIDIVAVRPNSAASASGILAGDKILAINGNRARNFSAADFVDIVTARAGTVIQLTIQRGSVVRNVRLVLR